MTFFYRIAVPVLAAVGVLFAVPFAAVAANQEHSGHKMAEHSGHGDEHSGHDTGFGDHIHHQHGADSWMFEYKFMRMTMEGLLDGTDSVSTSEAVAMAGAYGFMMAPTKMTMDMHMVMGMYGLTDKLSLMLMGNYLAKDMDMQARDGTLSSMDTSGIGDTQIGVMVALSKQWVTSVNVSIPTGSIDKKTDMVMSAMMTLQDVQQPYAMQLGSGTYDLIPSVTYQTRNGHWSWGGQGAYTYRMDENDNDYSLGNRFDVTAWVKRQINGNVMLSGRMNWNKWGNVDGADPALNLMMSPTNDPDAQGGSRLDVLLGINGMFAGGHMLGLELGVPVSQNLDGPQLETDMLVTFAYQYILL